MRVVPVLARAEQIVTPKVIGLVRPTILLPASAVSGLSTDELELILAHELAHVRRYDMWVNLVQRLAEAVLFFNPALPTQVGGVFAGNLRAWSMPIVYDTWASDDVTPGLVTDLSIYTTGPGFNFPETFDTHFQALAGSASIDLSAYLANFQPDGTSGPIFAGSSGNLGSPIGTWQITAVPELPVAAHLALYGAGFVGLVVYRRSRKA